MVRRVLAGGHWQLAMGAAEEYVEPRNRSRELETYVAEYNRRVLHAKKYKIYP